MITVFGSINLDLIGNVERLPSPGETVGDGRFATAAGGKGGNQALAAARAGSPVRMIGAVGRDANASPALDILRQAGVDLSRVREADAPTGVALILVDKHGENVIAVMPGANFAVAESDAEALAFDPGDVLLLQLEVPIPAIAAAAGRAQDSGVPVVLNFAPFRPEGLALLPLVTHLVVNESECALVAQAAGVAEGSLEAMAHGLADNFAVAVIVTLGRDGVIAVAKRELLRAAALPVTPIDTVGAGDTFCGYLASALAGRIPLGDALLYAAAAGSLACTRAGAQPAIPTQAEVNDALPA